MNPSLYLDGATLLLDGRGVLTFSTGLAGRFGLGVGLCCVLPR